MACGSAINWETPKIICKFFERGTENIGRKAVIYIFFHNFLRLFVFRAKIQKIYKGTVTSLDPDSIDLPSKLPRPLMVGTKVFAKIGGARDGIYAGIVDAMQDDGYRIVFEKEHLYPTTVVKVCLFIHFLAYLYIDFSGRSSYECSTFGTSFVIVFSVNE